MFVGRGEPISAIVRATANLPPTGHRSQTVLIEGPPGSGKTALLNEVAARLAADGVTATHLLGATPKSAGAVARTYGAIAEGIAGAPSPDRLSTAQDTFKVRASLGVVNGEAGRVRTAAHPVFEDASSVAGWRRATGGSDWSPMQRMVVAVDEVQEIAPDSPAAEPLQDLHTQQDIPVLLVCAGLGNSEERLESAGLSRIEHVIHLGRLLPDETLECAQRTLHIVAEGGVRGGDAAIGRWAERIARESDDWPRHLHAYLQATWKVLSGQRVPDFNTADLDAGMRAGALAREDYYRQRVGASRTPLALLRALHARIARDGPLDQEAARATLREALKQATESEREEWEERFGGRMQECYSQLLRAGIVALDRDRRCDSPIPSLADHLLGEGADSAQGP